MAHLSPQWRDGDTPLDFLLEQAQVSNGVVRVGDLVRELPAPHHIQPCACCLCRERPESERNVKVLGIGQREGDCTVYVLLPEGYACPASELELAPT